MLQSPDENIKIHSVRTINLTAILKYMKFRRLYVSLKHTIFKTLPLANLAKLIDPYGSFTLKASSAILLQHSMLAQSTLLA